MRAVEITEPGGPQVLQITDRPAPEPSPGEVLIKVKAAGVNRPDVVQRLGRYPAPPGASDIPGLEVAGVVEKVGENVEGFSVGDVVCALVQGGGYAEHCTAAVESVLPMPEGLSFIEAAALPETFFTVWSNLFDRAHLMAGESLLVHGGSSGIGTVAIQLAKAFGATVYTTVGSDEKAAYCHALGADVVINYRTENFVERISSLTDGNGVDVVLDMVGGDYLNKNIASLAADGRHVSIAFLNGPKAEINMLPVMLKRLTLTGSTLRARSNEFKGAIAGKLRDHVWPLIVEGKVKPSIHSVFELEDAAQAHELMESSKHMGKIMLKVGD